MILNRLDLTVIISVYTLFVYVSCNDSHDKRILVNGPDSIEEQVTHLQGEIQKLQATVQSNSAGGSTFVRWGRPDCPSNLTELVYSGYAGGSWYDDSGAAADYLCLPPDPEWPQTTVVPDYAAAKLYGAEYESHNSHSPFWSHSRDEDVPCAVCRSSFVSALMIPARTTCYTGWTKAYGGYLATGGYPYKGASEYACVDEHPISTGALHSNDNGRSFFGVQAFCGSLQCPPYQENKFVACVVCLK